MSAALPDGAHAHPRPARARPERTQRGPAGLRPGHGRDRLARRPVVRRLVPLHDLRVPARGHRGGLPGHRRGPTVHRAPRALRAPDARARHRAGGECPGQRRRCHADGRGHQPERRRRSGGAGRGPGSSGAGAAQREPGCCGRRARLPRPAGRGSPVLGACRARRPACGRCDVAHAAPRPGRAHAQRRPARLPRGDRHPGHTHHRRRGRGSLPRHRRPRRHRRAGPDRLPHLDRAGLARAAPVMGGRGAPDPERAGWRLPARLPHQHPPPRRRRAGASPAGRPGHAQRGGHRLQRHEHPHPVRPGPAGAQARRLCDGHLSAGARAPGDVRRRGRGLPRRRGEPRNGPGLAGDEGPRPHPRPGGHRAACPGAPADDAELVAVTRRVQRGPAHPPADPAARCRRPVGLRRLPPVLRHRATLRAGSRPRRADAPRRRAAPAVPARSQPQRRCAPRHVPARAVRRTAGAAAAPARRVRPGAGPAVGSGGGQPSAPRLRRRRPDLASAAVRAAGSPGLPLAVGRSRRPAAHRAGLAHADLRMGAAQPPRRKPHVLPAGRRGAGLDRPRRPLAVRPRGRPGRSRAGRRPAPARRHHPPARHGCGVPAELPRRHRQRAGEHRPAQPHPPAGDRRPRRTAAGDRQGLGRPPASGPARGRPDLDGTASRPALRHPPDRGRQRRPGAGADRRLPPARRRARRLLAGDRGRPRHHVQRAAERPDRRPSHPYPRRRRDHRAAVAGLPGAHPHHAGRSARRGARHLRRPAGQDHRHPGGAVHRRAGADRGHLHDRADPQLATRRRGPPADRAGAHVVVGRGRRFRVAPDVGLSDRGPPGVPRRAGRWRCGRVSSTAGCSGCTRRTRRVHRWSRSPTAPRRRSLPGRAPSVQRWSRSSDRRSPRRRPSPSRTSAPPSDRSSACPRGRGSRKPESVGSSPSARPMAAPTSRASRSAKPVPQLSLPDPFTGMEDLLRSVLDRTQRRILQPGPAPGPRSNGAPQIREGWLSLRRLEQLAP